MNCGCRRYEARRLDVHWDNGATYREYLEESEKAFDEWVESVKQGPAKEWDNHRTVFNAGYHAGRESVIDLIDDLFYTGMSSIDHVALANYPEREVEAKVRLRTAYNRVVDKIKKEIER